jgi:hypothetical protein
VDTVVGPYLYAGAAVYVLGVLDDHVTAQQYTVTAAYDAGSDTVQIIDQQGNTFTATSAEVVPGHECSGTMLYAYTPDC